MTFTMWIFTQPSPGQAESWLSEYLQCKSHKFFTKWCDLLDLSKQKKGFGSGFYIPQRGTRGGSLILLLKKCFYGTPWCLVGLSDTCKIIGEDNQPAGQVQVLMPPEKLT